MNHPRRDIVRLHPSDNLLRQNYCRPATITGKRNRDLFPLEKDSEDGKALFAKTPDTRLHLQEFDPYGLHQTYRDESTGAELPVFAVFDLEGSHKIACEITTDSVPATAQTKSLPAYIPFKKTQAFVRKINARRMKAEQAVTRLSVILGILPVLAYIFTHVTIMASGAVLYLLMGGWFLCTSIAILLSLIVLNRLLPWKKLVVTAEFNGLLPKEAREKAWAAKKHFDTLYLIVDQQHRWKSALLRDPRPRALDPLLIGELIRGRCRKYFLIPEGADLVDMAALPKVTTTGAQLASLALKIVARQPGTVFVWANRFQPDLSRQLYKTL